MCTLICNLLLFCSSSHAYFKSRFDLPYIMQHCTQVLTALQYQLTKLLART